MSRTRMCRVITVCVSVQAPLLSIACVCVCVRAYVSVSMCVCVCVHVCVPLSYPCPQLAAIGKNKKCWFWWSVWRLSGDRGPLEIAGRGGRAALFIDICCHSMLRNEEETMGLLFTHCHITVGWNQSSEEGLALLFPPCMLPLLFIYLFINFTFFFLKHAPRNCAIFYQSRVNWHEWWKREISRDRKRGRKGRRGEEGKERRGRKKKRTDSTRQTQLSSSSSPPEYSPVFFSPMQYSFLSKSHCEV